ncbi:MAG: HD domain-containing protein [Akkermansiaceae bacterium]|nr:HD domain-containing protein [Akkermansiaceae bacterium]NNM29211.1 HD domain-containing protein [Akkermansiaceae bacterium]
MTIADLKHEAGETPLDAAVEGQLQKRLEKTTKKGDPYLELTLADATSSFALKAWSNHKQFTELAQLPANTFLRIEGKWTQNQYGLDSGNWRFRVLDDTEAAAFLSGDPETQARQSADWDHLVNTMTALGDPRLKALARMFLDQFGDRFRRAAAAKKNHHARRGGLVEHVAQMMRSAEAICGVYPELNRDLLLAGVLFHDCGKIWENNYPEAGFAQAVSLHGEMLGHIPLGIEVVNKLWRDLLDTDDAASWTALAPSNEQVRLHLLHLIASHHGQYDFGSPTLPRSPEAFALHYIDNLDAKMEMIRMAYEAAPETVPGIYERQFPLPAPLVAPLATLDGEAGSPPAPGPAPQTLL